MSIPAAPHNLMISNGGTLNVAGTITSNAAVFSGGIEQVFSGGIATRAMGAGTAISGGTVSVLSGGTLDHVTVFAGGELYVAGAVLSNVAISGGGTENILSESSIGGALGSGTSVSATPISKSAALLPSSP